MYSNLLISGPVRKDSLLPTKCTSQSSDLKVFKGWKRPLTFRSEPDV